MSLKCSLKVVFFKDCFQIQIKAFAFRFFSSEHVVLVDLSSASSAPPPKKIKTENTPRVFDPVREKVLRRVTKLSGPSLAVLVRFCQLNSLGAVLREREGQAVRWEVDLEAVDDSAILIINEDEINIMNTLYNCKHE